ncbi:MAG: hypothetical protein NUV31_02710 [Dehalococcoidales bacterium]|jgi:ArsR family metal-binding transcriptional regulator|nr:hypothetical protein [Dehalococcoidales bacterium]
MARAVIELSGNISSALPILNRAVASCRYNPEEQTATLYQGTACVIVEPEKLTIYNITDEAAAKNLVEELKNILKNSITK